LELTEDEKRIYNSLNKSCGKNINAIDKKIVKSLVKKKMAYLKNIRELSWDGIGMEIQTAIYPFDITDIARNKVGNKNSIWKSITRFVRTKNGYYK
jgi:hypothetical protein